MAGATAIAERDLLAGLRRVSKTRPNALMLVPAACELLVDRFKAVLEKLAPTIDRVSIGSAAISPVLLERLQRLLPDARIHIPYGMTEARIGFLEPLAGRAERRLAAVDPNLELRVLDEAGAPVERGIGEVVLRGPALMLGYWHNRDEENQELHHEGFYTRDMMEITPAGDRLLAGRLDDVVSVGGEKVFPAEVEVTLMSYSGIRDARVVAERDPRGILGQVVKARIVLDPEAEFDRDDLLAHCRTRLEPYKIPSIIERVAEIKRDAMGKVSRLERE